MSGVSVIGSGFDDPPEGAAFVSFLDCSCHSPSLRGHIYGLNLFPVWLRVSFSTKELRLSSQAGKHASLYLTKLVIDLSFLVFFQKPVMLLNSRFMSTDTGKKVYGM